jgi:DNA-binding transcriptional regulator LsrR (DeoR family)
MALARDPRVVIWSGPHAMASSTQLDLLRLTTRAARLYHESGLSQIEVAAALGLSQARVSRLLKQARALGIVRTTVHVPEGVYADLEEKLEALYKLDQIAIADVPDGAGHDETAVMRGLASTTARLLEAMLPNCAHVGVSSWSETLLSAVSVMRPTAPGLKTVIQLLGGLGRAQASASATRLTEALARLTHAEAHMLMAPGVVASEKLVKALYQEPSCLDVFERYDHLSAVLMGIGALPPSRLLLESSSMITDDDIAALDAAGAVGDVCMRFFDAKGRPVSSGFDKRVVGIRADQIRAVRHRIGVAGGTRKFEAIRAVLRGRWVSTLVTDHATAKRLLTEP